MQTREGIKETIVSIIKDSFPSVVRREVSLGNQVDIYLSDQIIGKCADRISTLIIEDRRRVVAPLIEWNKWDKEGCFGNDYNNHLEGAKKANRQALKNAGIE